MLKLISARHHPNRLAHLGQKVQIFVSKGPAYHYTYGRWRLSRWLDRRRDRPALLDDKSFFSQLNLNRPEMAQVRQAVDRGDDQQARLELKNYFQTRSTPRGFFEPVEVEQILAGIDSSRKKTTLETADKILQNSFHFRRAEPVQFEDEIDWNYRPQGNIDWAWDLNRQAYLESLGRAYLYTRDEQYALKFKALLHDWLAKNPPGVDQPNWSSVFEVAFRINIWLWAFYYFRSSAAFDAETCYALLQGLYAHGWYLDRYLELHVQNNHLLLEAKALAMLGLLMPEFKPAAKWRQRGLQVMYREIRTQIHPDGVHGEQATLYHRIIAGELLELLVVLANNDVLAPEDIIQTLGRMVEFELWLTKPDGLVPLLGDSALEDTFLRFSAIRGGPAFLNRAELKRVAPPPDEAEVWLLGPRRVKQYSELPAEETLLTSRDFPDGGYFIMRQGQDAAQATYLVFDAGPFGYKPVPSHGHADALSFEMFAFGQTHLIDPGVYGTRLGDDWRNFFRSSRAHNTVLVDEQDQSRLVDTWRVYRPARTVVHQWQTDDEFDFVDASQDGYERLAEPVRHRRQIFFAKPEYWVIIDTLTGQGNHCFDLLFHLAPDKAYRFAPDTYTLITGDETSSGIIISLLAAKDLQVEVITGATDPIQGWASFFSGEKNPAPTLRYRQEKTAPAQFCTLLYPYSAGADVQAHVIPLEVETDFPSLPEDRLTALQIETNTHLDYLVVDRGAAGTAKHFAGYTTTAYLTYLRHHKEQNELAKVILRGSDDLSFQGKSLLNPHKVINSG